jgi:hypothetical protein
VVSVSTKRRKMKLTMSEPSSNLEQVNRAEVKLLQKYRNIKSKSRERASNPKNSLTSSLEKQDKVTFFPIRTRKDFGRTTF